MLTDLQFYLLKGSIDKVTESGFHAITVSGDVEKWVIVLERSVVVRKFFIWYIQKSIEELFDPQQKSWEKIVLLLKKLQK